MIRFETSRAGLMCLCLAVLASQAACTDLPTGTDAFQLEADGQIWVAVLPPANLPDASTWLGYAAPDPVVAGLAREEVTALQERAHRARAMGDLERADALLDEADQRAVMAMEVSPPIGVFVAARASLDSWQRSVRAGVDLSEVPALAETAAAVERDGEAVDAALTEGDTRTVALRLTAAARRIREWSPDGVALRVLDRAEAHLAATAKSPGEGERAAQLVHSARQALIGGNPLRAMQRALYALQLAGGSELREIPAEEVPSCGEYSC